MKFVWMCLCVYRHPRAIQAYGSLSELYTAHQGNVAGCTHATTLLLVRQRLDTLLFLLPAHALMVARPTTRAPMAPRTTAHRSRRRW